MDLVTSVVLEWLEQHLWPLTRVSAMIGSMALFSGTLVNARIKVFLSLAIILAVSPALPEVSTGVENISGWLYDRTTSGYWRSLGVGIAAFPANIRAWWSGHCDVDWFGFASMVDPTNGQQVPVIAQFFLCLRVWFSGFEVIY